MKKLIDLETWERRDNFRFFQTFVNPCISMTAEVDCTEGFNLAKEKKISFFLLTLYATLRAANEVKEFRYRIENGDVYEYDKVDGVSPIQVTDEGRFCSMRFPFISDLKSFLAKGSEIVSAATPDTDPYALSREMESTGDNGVILLSVTPKLYFTSLTHTQETPIGSPYPLMNAGKVITREGRKYMPFAFVIHHGLMDGFHMGKFIEKIEFYINSVDSLK